MANLNKTISDTALRLGEVRFSYVNVFSKRINPDGTQGKYSVCVIIPKSNTEAVDLFKQAYENTKLLGKTTKWGGKIPAKVQLPLHDGDEERPDDPAFEDCWYFNCSSQNAPGIRVKDELGQVVEALDDGFIAGLNVDDAVGGVDDDRAAVDGVLCLVVCGVGVERAPGADVAPAEVGSDGVAAFAPLHDAVVDADVLAVLELGVDESLLLRGAELVLAFVEEAHEVGQVLAEGGHDGVGAPEEDAGVPEEVAGGEELLGGGEVGLLLEGGHGDDVVARLG